MKSAVLFLIVFAPLAHAYEATSFGKLLGVPTTGWQQVLTDEAELQLTSQCVLKQDSGVERTSQLRVCGCKAKQIAEASFKAAHIPATATPDYGPRQVYAAMMQWIDSHPPEIKEASNKCQ